MGHKGVGGVGGHSHGAAAAAAPPGGEGSPHLPGRRDAAPTESGGFRAASRLSPNPESPQTPPQAFPQPPDPSLNLPKEPPEPPDSLQSPSRPSLASPKLPGFSQQPSGDPLTPIRTLQPPPQTSWNPRDIPEPPTLPPRTPPQNPLWVPLWHPQTPSGCPPPAAPRPPGPHHVVAGCHVAEVLGQQPAGLLHSPMCRRVQWGPPVLIPHIGVVACLQQQPVGWGWGLEGRITATPPLLPPRPPPQSIPNPIRTLRQR